MGLDTSSWTDADWDRHHTRVAWVIEAHRKVVDDRIMVDGLRYVVTTGGYVPDADPEGITGRYLGGSPNTGRSVRSET